MKIFVKLLIVRYYFRRITLSKPPLVCTFFHKYFDVRKCEMEIWVCTNTFGRLVYVCLPVTTCEVARAFSMLRRIHTYLPKLTESTEAEPLLCAGSTKECGEDAGCVPYRQRVHPEHDSKD